VPRAGPALSASFLPARIKADADRGSHLPEPPDPAAAHGTGAGGDRGGWRKKWALFFLLAFKRETSSRPEPPPFRIVITRQCKAEPSDFDRSQKSIWAVVRRLSSAGVRARANSRRAVGKVTSSYVRIEMIQATSCSKGERNPSSASSNSAAFGRGRTASPMRESARSISNNRFAKRRESLFVRRAHRCRSARAWRNCTMLPREIMPWRVVM
jgi:hypothetical protein